MDALLLAAGLGTRLQPLTGVLPKCLMPIHGRPLLGLWLEMLKRGGTEKVFINLHYLAPLVREYVTGSPYNSMVEFLDEPTLCGTAGTLNKFRNRFTSRDMLLAHADNLTMFDVAAFRQTYEGRPAHAALTMMTFDTDAPETCGMVTLDTQNIVIKFVEKPKESTGTLANGAVYLMRLPEILKIMDQGQAVTDFSTEVLPHFIGRMNSFHNDIYHRDIGNIAALSSAQLEIDDLGAAADLINSVNSYWDGSENRQDQYQQFKKLLEKLSVTKPVMSRLLQP